MFPTGLLRFVVWGSEKLFLGVLTKNKFFFSQITHNDEHIKNYKKISKNHKCLDYFKLTIHFEFEITIFKLSFQNHFYHLQ